MDIRSNQKLMAVLPEGLSEAGFSVFEKRLKLKRTRIELATTGLVGLITLAMESHIIAVLFGLIDSVPLSLDFEEEEASLLEIGAGMVIQTIIRSPGFTGTYENPEETGAVLEAVSLALSRNREELATFGVML